MIVWIHSPSSLRVNVCAKENGEVTLASMEHKTVNAYLLITMNTDFINQVLFVPQGTERRHKPAIAIATLTYITRRGTFLVEDRTIEYVLEFISLRNKISCLQH